MNDTPSAKVDVGVFVGSLRKQSFNRCVANALVAIAAPPLRLSILEIGALPFYDQDREADPPREWTDFRDRVRSLDAVLFVTPEYNRSVPGVLKNAIDVGSRPHGKSVWDGKPGAVISASPGAIGGFGANHHLRQSLVFLNVPALQAPEAYIGRVDKLLDGSGNLTNEDTRKFLRGFLGAFADWIGRNAHTKAAAGA